MVLPVAMVRAEWRKWSIMQDFPAMQHTDKQANSKLLPSCSLPITGLKCVKKVVTELAVFEIKDGVFVLTEYAPGVVSKI